MAFGEHWEWRGFGNLPPPLRRRIDALPRKYLACQEVTDEYLHAPGMAINVKLRDDCLKFKRLTATAGGLERWLEDAGENHPFPLAPGVIAKLFRDLGLSAGAPPEDAPDKKSLLKILGRAQPKVVLVRVKKRRWQREWRPAAAAGKGGEGIIVELAEIASPERITSVGIEHSDAGQVQAAREDLCLPSGLREISYLGAIAAWARRERVGS